MNVWVKYTQMLYILLGQNHVQNVFSTLRAMDEVIIISGGFSGEKNFITEKNSILLLPNI